MSLFERYSSVAQIAQTLGEIARSALTATAASNAIHVLCTIARNGKIQAVAELAATLDAHFGYGTSAAAYQAHATIESLVAVERLPPIVRLYAGAFFHDKTGLDWDQSSAHSAVYDAERTAEIFCFICNRMKDIGFVHVEASIRPRSAGSNCSRRGHRQR